MKNSFLHIVFCLALVFGASTWANAQVNDRKPTGGVSIGNNNSPIPILTLNEVLAAAAPFFNMQPTQFIRLYYTCGCITVEEITPTTYRVTYGGIGIMIVIDATRGSRGVLRPTIR